MKTREEAAREWVENNFDFSMMHAAIQDITKKDYVKSFLAGIEWLGSQASERFEEFCQKANDSDSVAGWMISAKVLADKDFCRFLWKNAQLSSAKLLAEKDAEIERLRSIKSHQSDLIDIKSKAIIEKDAEIRELCQLIVHTFSFVEENKDFFWLGDNIHSVYYSEKNTIKKAKALLGEE